MYTRDMTTTPQPGDYLTLHDGRGATVVNVDRFYPDDVIVDTDDGIDRFWTNERVLGGGRIVRNHTAEDRTRMARWTRTGSATH
jgi:hypothetical protein